MDTTAEAPKNSITIIEDFIQKWYPGDPKYCGSIPSHLPFEFLPGHKIVIDNFVREVKEAFQKKKVVTKTATNLKSLTSGTRSGLLPKHNNPSTLKQEPLSPEEIRSTVLHQIRTWLQKQKDSNIQKLVEGKDYDVKVISLSKVCVFCSFCSTSLYLPSDKSTEKYRISNWCRHIKRCVTLRCSISSQAKLHFLSKTKANCSSSSGSMILPSHSSNETKDGSVSLSTDESDIPVSQPPQTSFSDDDGNDDNQPRNEQSVNDNMIFPVQAQSSSSESNQVFQIAPPLIKTSASGGDSSKNKTDWSRSARKKRHLLKAADDPAQTEITDYFETLKEIDSLIAKNQKLSKMISQLSAVIRQYDDVAQGSSDSGSSFAPVLNEILQNAKRNATRNPNNHRHSDILKKFSAALFIYAGPLTYEFIEQNLSKSLPSLCTIQRHIRAEYKTFHEGVFRFDELLVHISQFQASRLIAISEDATRIISRVDYDVETDRCVGFVLPVNACGLPIVDSFLAVSFAAIEDMFKTASLAKYAYVYMAQPLDSKAPPFCLACVGSNNKFTAEQVLLRWKYIYNECKKRDIIVTTFSGDGDSRIMKAMKTSSSLFCASNDGLKAEVISTSPAQQILIPETWKEWFHAELKSSISYVQDTVHLGVKLKARLLKPSIVLPMGPYYLASGNHIRLIQMAFGKDQHNLRERDVNHRDKQNFDAVLRIVSTMHLLKKMHLEHVIMLKLFKTQLIAS